MVKKPTHEYALRQVGEQLKGAASRLGMSIYQLSAVSEIARPSVRAALTGGNITLTTLLDLTRVLHVKHLRIGELDVEFGGGGVDNALVRSAVERLDRAEHEMSDATNLLRRAAGVEAHFREEAVRLTGMANAPYQNPGTPNRGSGTPYGAPYGGGAPYNPPQNPGTPPGGYGNSGYGNSNSQNSGYGNSGSQNNGMPNSGPPNSGMEPAGDANAAPENGPQDPPAAEEAGWKKA
jgi:hypothetical protein